MKNEKVIEIEVKGKDWEKALDQAFKKRKKDIKIPGFRAGSITKEMYIKKVGIESLFMDASDIAINEAYKDALKDADMELVCQPNVELEKVDKDGCKFKFTFIGKPEVKLGKYKKLGIKKDKVDVSKEEIEHEIKHIQEHMAEMITKENGKIVEGNVAIIDFKGYVDGEELQGGTGTDYNLEIGSNTFIPGFEEGLVGLSIGETKTLNLKFPDDYVENLKGKKVKFDVTIKGIKEKVVPELNKDFFEDLGIEGVDTKAKLEAHIKEEITKEKEKHIEDKYVDDLLRAATDNMKVDINNEIIDEEVHRMIHQYEHELQHQGATIDQYLTMTGTTIEDLKSMMKPQAIARIKTRYLLEEIVKEEKITVTKAEIKAEVKKNAEKYELKEEEFLDYVGGEDNVKYDLEMQKAMDIIKEG
jgi:trigger factor